MDIDATVELSSSLRGETDALLRKQRRKGVEYRFREGTRRPSLLLETATSSSSQAGGGAGADPFAPLAENGRVGSPDRGGSSPTAGGSGRPATSGLLAPGAASGTTTLLAATTSTTTTKVGGGGGGGGGGGSGGMSLDAYDPKEVAAKEERLLQEVVARLRVESSRARHAVETKQRQFDALQSELLKLKFEDDVSVERDDGLRAMAEEKDRIAAQQAEYDATLQYEKTLAHMLDRAQRDKLSQLAALRSFEDALRVHKHELELSESLLRTVHKSRDAEVAELARMRADVKKQLHVLDGKLEARRLEVISSTATASLPISSRDCTFITMSRLPP